MTMTAHSGHAHDVSSGTRRINDEALAEGQSARCGGATYPHHFRTVQAGVALSRVVCTMCGTVRIQQTGRNLVVSWSRADYEIADRFYRELVS